MRRTVPNPFLEATFGELCQAISDAARTLEERRFRSRAEKEAFAERVRSLLLACGMRFMSAGGSIPGSPEMPLDRDPRNSVAECFMPWYRKQLERETGAVRRYTLWRAADCVLGRESLGFLEPHTVLWSERRGYIGTRDDRSLEKVLRELDDLRRKDSQRPERSR